MLIINTTFDFGNGYWESSDRSRSELERAITDGFRGHVDTYRGFSGSHPEMKMLLAVFRSPAAAQFRMPAEVASELGWLPTALDRTTIDDASAPQIRDALAAVARIRSASHE